MHAASYTAVLRSIVDQGNIDSDGDDDDDDCGGGESGGGEDDDDVDDGGGSGGSGGGGGGGDEHAFTATHAGDETFEKFALVPRNMYTHALVCCCCGGGRQVHVASRGIRNDCHARGLAA